MEVSYPGALNLHGSFFFSFSFLLFSVFLQRTVPHSLTDLGWVPELHWADRDLEAQIQTWVAIQQLAQHTPSLEQTAPIALIKVLSSCWLST